MRPYFSASSSLLPGRDTAPVDPALRLPPVSDLSPWLHFSSFHGIYRCCPWCGGMVGTVGSRIRRRDLLAMAAQQFREIRNLERESLASLDLYELVPGPPCISRASPAPLRQGIHYHCQHPGPVGHRPGPCCGHFLSPADWHPGGRDSAPAFLINSFPDKRADIGSCPPGESPLPGPQCLCG